MTLFLEMSAKITLIQRFFRRFKEKHNVCDENKMMMVDNVNVLNSSDDSEKIDTVYNRKTNEFNNKNIRENIISCKSNNYYSNSLYNLDIELIDDSTNIFN